MDTPLPIPNREVKHFNGENSVSEDSKLPIFFCLFFFAGGGGVVAEKIWGGVEGKAKGRKKPRRQITCDDVVRKA